MEFVGGPGLRAVDDFVSAPAGVSADVPGDELAAELAAELADAAAECALVNYYH